MKLFVALGASDLTNAPKDLRVDQCNFVVNGDDGERKVWSCQATTFDSEDKVQGECTITFESKNIHVHDITNSDWSQSEVTEEDFEKYVSKIHRVDLCFTSNDLWKWPRDAEASVVINDRFFFSNDGCAMNVRFERFLP